MYRLLWLLNLSWNKKETWSIISLRLVASREDNIFGEIRLDLRLTEAILWKKEVFRSLSFTHLILDFRYQHLSLISLNWSSSIIRSHLLFMKLISSLSSWKTKLFIKLLSSSSRTLILLVLRVYLCFYHLLTLILMDLSFFHKVLDGEFESPNVEVTRFRRSWSWNHILKIWKTEVIKRTHL